MTASTRDRVVQALARALEDAHPGSAPCVDPEGYAATLDAVLLPSLNAKQRQVVRERLTQADGNELAGDRPGALAAHSSAAAAANLFGVWTDRPGPVSIGTLGGFTTPMTLEAKLPFQRGGRPPNLDALATGPSEFVGIESKLTEPLTRHSRRPWQASISCPANMQLLDGGWRELLEEAIAGTFHTERLESGQLLRHALGIARNTSVRATLAYAYWEPVNAEQFPEYQQHREDIAAFAERVTGSALGFVAITHREIIDGWDTADAPEWLRQHCAAWRGRYQIAV